MLDMNFKSDPFKKARIKLTLSYVAIVAIVLLLFSLGLYTLFVEDVVDNIVGYDVFENVDKEYEEEHSLDDDFNINVESRLYFVNRANDRLVYILIFLDSIILIITIMFSYYFAGKTLRPIEQMYIKQNKFIADAAHEFRTPLTVLKTGAETTLAGSSGIKLYQKLAKDFINEIDYLTIIINDLLFLSQSNFEKKHAFHKFNLSNLLKQEILFLQEYANLKKIELKYDIEEEVSLIGSQSQIKRLITNLVKNAIDYNKIDGLVFVLLKKQKTNIIMEVNDEGIGMSQKDIDHMFDRFYKSDKARTGGAGLGLAIAKEIIINHNAQVKVESNIDKGTNICIIF